jgi:geranylgeranyl transferase type-2 subunit alpha
LLQIAQHEYTPEVLQKTAELLKINPEYYTVWNHRRRIYASEFDTLQKGVTDGSIKREDHDNQILDIIQLDLQFLFPLLLKFPKCYWIWNHRLWLLEQATLHLQPATARRLWEEELTLVGKMLTRDSRNFLGWGYRRTVVASLESKALNGSSMAKTEFDYTTKMIGLNLSNFSAWHNRTKLILSILEEKSATDEERRQMLDDGELLDSWRHAKTLIA